MIEEAKNAASAKFVGLPVWSWILIGGGVFFLFSSRQKSPSANYTPATPTTDQMTAGQINDLQSNLGDVITQMEGDINDRFGAMTQVNADQLANQKNFFEDLMNKEMDNQDKILAALSANAAAFQQEITQSNSSFLTALQNALNSQAHPNGTAPPTTTDPGAALPQWAKDALNNPLMRNRAYIQNPNTFLQPDGPYGQALNDFFRSDTINGLNAQGQTQAGWSQLNALLQSGGAIKNPYYVS